jgi:hypothetical protein
MDQVATDDVTMGEQKLRTLNHRTASAERLI